MLPLASWLNRQHGPPLTPPMLICVQPTGTACLRSHILFSIVIIILPFRQEPTEPYLIIKDPQAYLDPKRLYSPRPGMQR